MANKSKTQARAGGPKLGQTSWFEQLSPARKDLLCIGVLYVVVLVVFNGIIFSNMVFSDSGDTAAADAWFKAIDHIDKVEHVEPVWIPYIFSGMPIFGALIFPREVNYIHQYVILPISRILFFGIDVHWLIMPFLILGVSMFFLARQLKFGQIPSLIAGLTFMLNPYAVGLPETGHGSKLMTLAYIPLLFLMTYNLLERGDFLSMGLLSATVGTMLLCRHPQMAFYGLLVIGLYFVYTIILDARVNPLSTAKRAALFIIALGIGFALWSYQYLPTQEYGQYSIRGGGETGVTGGLSYDYATNWSFHPLELISFFIPGVFGLDSTGQLYWGWMPFTNSTLYAGLVPLFLAIIALFYRRNRMMWFLTILSALLFLLSFGKHFGLLYDLMFNYFPYFNKLRTPVMILHLIPLTIGLMAAYGFSYVSDLVRQARDPDLLKIRNRLRNAIAVIGLVFIIGLLFNDAVFSFLSGFMFQKEGELAQYMAHYGARAAQAIAQVQKMRFDLLWKDYIKFAFIAVASLGMVIVYCRKKIGEGAFGAGLIAILIIDLVILDVKYINPRPKGAVADYYQPTPEIQKLQAERDSSIFRVFPLGQLDQQERGNIMMYSLLESVEGYSPAKLKIYQEMRDSCLERGNRNVINMLNVKYLVGDQQMQDGSVRMISQENPGYLPRTWFVDSAVISHSKTETFGILNSPSWNPARTAILEKEPAGSPSGNGAATASVAKWGSREITITTSSANPRLLVLSEMYYPVGWKAFVDGSETEIFKTNHILRSVMVPAGNHTVVFKFDPPTYNLGYTLTQAAWGLTGVLLIGGLLLRPDVRKKLGLKGKEPGQVPEAVQSSQ